jgi:hypothetical protein
MKDEIRQNDSEQQREERERRERIRPVDRVAVERGPRARERGRSEDPE